MKIISATIKFRLTYLGIFFLAVFTLSDLAYAVRIKDLAGRLNITSHQLSEFLNRHFGIDFNSFINTYRVEEAKRMLRDNRDQSIISICYEVGFSTKASFNSAFKRITGITPSAFRNDALR